MGGMDYLTVVVESFEEDGGSDIHLTPCSEPRFRVKGEIRTKENLERIDDEKITFLVDSLMEATSGNNEKKRLFLQREIDERGHVSFSVSLGDSRFRVQVSRYLSSFYIVMRKLSSSPPSIDALGFDEKTRKGLLAVTKRKNGLFLVTGATGSGKSTTLAALIDRINEEYRKNIITLEDPVEYLFTPKRSNVVQKELGRDFYEFYEGIRAALREDPDVVMVGEIRDRKTLDLALELSETGHLVFGTLHTNSAVATIQRMTAMSDAPSLTRERLSQTLIGILAQSIFKRKDNGDVAVAWEFLYMNKAILANVREGEDVQINSIMDNVEYSNSFNRCIERLYCEGKLDEDTAVSISPDPKYLDLEKTGNKTDSLASASDNGTFVIE